MEGLDRRPEPAGDAAQRIAGGDGVARLDHAAGSPDGALARPGGSGLRRRLRTSRRGRRGLDRRTGRLRHGARLAGPAALNGLDQEERDGPDDQEQAGRGQEIA